MQVRALLLRLIGTRVGDEDVDADAVTEFARRKDEHQVFIKAVIIDIGRRRARFSKIITCRAFCIRTYALIGNKITRQPPRMLSYTYWISWLCYICYYVNLYYKYCNLFHSVMAFLDRLY
jgi:hypothetical protein